MGNCHRHWVKAKSCDVVQAHKSCTTHAHSGPPLLLSRVRMRPFLSERALPGVRRPVTISRNATRNCFHSALPFASLPPLFASFSLAIFTFYILYIYIYTFEEERSSIVAIEANLERSIVRKDGISSNETTRKLRGPVSIAPRDSSTLLSQRVQTLSFRLFIAESPRERDRRLCAVSGEFGASRARIGGLNVEQRISLVFYDSCSTFQPNRAHDAIIRSGSKQNATILFSPPTQSTNYNYRHVNRPDTSTANSTSSPRQTTNVFRSNNPGLLTKLP